MDAMDWSAVDWSAVDWNVWGPPLAVMAVGAVAGLLIAARAGGRLKGDDAMAQLEARREVVMTQLRALEVDRDKLNEADFLARKQALVAEAAELLRRRDAGVGEDEAPAVSTEKSSSTLVMGAVGLLLFLGVTAFSLQQAAQPRRDGASMTGNQDLGGVEASAQMPPEIAAAFAALEANPDDLEALNFLTRVSLQMNDLQGAMQHLDRARKVAPEDPAVLTHLAALQMIIGRMDEARAQLLLALERQPGFPEARIWLALVEGNSGNWDAAEAELQGVMEDPTASDRDAAEARGLLASLKTARAQQGMAAEGGAAAGAGSPSAGGPSQGAPAEAGPPQVSGTVTAAGDIAPGGVLYVYARASDATRGPPLAAKRIADWSLPLDFTLGPEDLVMATEFPEQFWVHAKISRSGDPMKRSDDDVLSVTVGPLAPGAEGVNIQLGGE